MSIEFNIDKLCKKYGSQVLFSDLSFSVKTGTALSISGKNGSGKSTLLKILCGLIKPDKGNIELKISNEIIEKGNYYQHIGFVSPYLNLYDELTMSEHIDFISKLRKESVSVELVEYLSQAFILKNENKIVKQFSSGMKQKLKYILAMMFKPEILILDEPYTNLDKSAIDFLDIYLSEYVQSNSLIIASNDLIEQKISNLEIKIG